MSNPYDVLGVNSSDSHAVIHTRYRELVRLYHPDGGIQPNEELAVQINVAWSALSTTDARAATDARLARLRGNRHTGHSGDPRPPGEDTEPQMGSSGWGEPTTSAQRPTSATGKPGSGESEPAHHRTSPTQPPNARSRTGATPPSAASVSRQPSTPSAPSDVASPSIAHEADRTPSERVFGSENGPNASRPRMRLRLILYVLFTLACAGVAALFLGPSSFGGDYAGAAAVAASMSATIGIAAWLIDWVGALLGGGGNRGLAATAYFTGIAVAAWAVWSSVETFVSVTGTQESGISTSAVAIALSCILVGHGVARVMRIASSFRAHTVKAICGIGLVAAIVVVAYTQIRPVGAEVDARIVSYESDKAKKLLGLPGVAHSDAFNGRFQVKILKITPHPGTFDVAFGAAAGIPIQLPAPSKSCVVVQPSGEVLRSNSTQLLQDESHVAVGVVSFPIGGPGTTDFSMVAVERSRWQPSTCTDHPERRMTAEAASGTPSSSADLVPSISRARLRLSLRCICPGAPTRAVCGRALRQTRRDCQLPAADMELPVQPRRQQAAERAHDQRAQEPNEPAQE